MYNSKQITFLLILLSITAILMLILLCTLCITWIYQVNQEEDIVQVTENNISNDVHTNSNNYYQITSDERELLAKIVTCESSICSLECQKDVCSVIFNRLDSGKWGDSLEEVIYYPNAFSPTIDGSLDRCTTPCKSAYEAVDYVIKYGPTVPTYVRYFRASYDFNWDGYQNYKVIDNVYFGYFTDWTKGAW